MVAPFDLSRYLPPLDYLRGRVEGLLRLLDAHVDAGFVRSESAELLRELVDFIVPRVNLPALEQKVRIASAVDVVTLQTGYDLIASAPKDPASPIKNVEERLANVEATLRTIRAQQHRWPRMETILRLGLAVEGWLTAGIMSIAQGWDPQPLIALVRDKVSKLGAHDLARLWGYVLSENRPADDPDLKDYRLADHGVLPAGFLDPSATDLVDRLSRYYAWLRPRIIREMTLRGVESYPVPDIGLAKLLSLQSGVEAPSSSELTLVRSLANVAGWLAYRNGVPLGVDQFAAMLGVKEDGWA